jgi:alkylresorcinol/alkylpyrone synthase
MSVEKVPKILSVATAVPRYRISQNDIREAVARMFDAATGAFPKLARVYSNAARRTRYSYVRLDWYEHLPVLRTHSFVP